MLILISDSHSSPFRDCPPLHTPFTATWNMIPGSLTYSIRAVIFSHCVHMCLLPVDRSYMSSKHLVYHVLNFLNISTIFLEASLLFIAKSYPIFIPIFMSTLFSNTHLI